MLFCNTVCYVKHKKGGKTMADRLVKFYEEAEQLGGFKAKMRLAILTTIANTKAASEPDSPENIKKFENAMSEIKKEFN